MNISEYSGRQQSKRFHSGNIKSGIWAFFFFTSIIFVGRVRTKKSLCKTWGQQPLATLSLHSSAYDRLASLQKGWRGDRGGRRAAHFCINLRKIASGEEKEGREEGKQRRMIRPPGQDIRHCQNCFVSRYWTSGARYEPAYHLPGHNPASPEHTGLVSDLSATHSSTSTQGTEEDSTSLHGRRLKISNDHINVCVHYQQLDWEHRYFRTLKGAQQHNDPGLQLESPINNHPYFFGTN